MRRLALLLLLILAASPLLAEGPPPSTPRVLMLSLDGLKPDYLLNADEHGLAIPNLHALMRDGVHATGVVGVLPTVTYPSHVTLITGVTPSIHGIESNKVLDPEDHSQEAWYWFASDIRVPTLIHAAKARGLVTGSVSWPASIGLPADYLMPEFWRGRSRHPFDRRFLDSFSTPGLMEAVGRQRNKPVPSFSEMTDRDRTDVAKWIIRTAKPDLLLVHLFDLDFAQHRTGPASPEAFRALEANDAMLGELLDELRDAGVLESTVIFIVSDHGFFPTHTTVAPNTLLVDAGLIRLDDQSRVKEWDAYFLCEGGAASLALRDSNDHETLAKVDRLVSAKASEEESGIFRVLRSEETRAMGSRSPLVLDAASGYDFSGRVAGAWSGPSWGGGAHGHAPDRPESRAPLVVSGGGIRQRGSIGQVAMTRIAPTVAAILGLRLDPEADAPLEIDLEASAAR